ncbi:hypothetical protein M2165_004845 [Variovorax sp. TBS-050B]|uniref:hypothetical protein n=1 Tax=Variovorax sp. TBS-050B TaxID=2940551 RepID=UPI002476058D|nr:hypothetical protein [Variovorax sp. TBS-050B]MDH6594956.1 hypothetical protein [Variovorax sp. TBS-050B]
MTSFESFPSAPSEQNGPVAVAQDGGDLASRAELFAELHATRLVLSRTEQMLEQARLEQNAQATLRRAYEEARLSCVKMEALLQATVAESEQCKAEKAQAIESLRQMQASTSWRLCLRLRRIVDRIPLLRRFALQILRRLRG